MLDQYLNPYLYLYIMVYISVKKNQPETFIELRGAQGSSSGGDSAGSWQDFVEHGFSIELYIHMLHIYHINLHINMGYTDNYTYVK